MNRNDDVGSFGASHWRVYAWGALAALTCPCHLPILALLLSGTAAGAFISSYLSLAIVALTGLFVLSLAQALRAFQGRT